MLRKWPLIPVIIILSLTITAGCRKQIPPGAAKETPPIGQETPPTPDPTEPVEPALIGKSGVAADLGNITNRDMFRLSEAAKSLLAENGFVVVSGRHREFFPLYEENRYDPIPQLVTTDSLLHTYHLFFDFLLRTVETEGLAPELEKLNAAMLAQSREQYAALKGTAWENAARRNVAFFAVGAKLLDPSITVPAEVETEVEEELALIAIHEGIALSPVMNIGGDFDPLDALKEDYSQYIPRGHYDRSEVLQAYFKSMMWYTDPNGFVLEEAIGYIDEIYAAVPVDGKLRIAKGGVYSYYEFTWPLNDRLTDTQWRQMLEAQTTPPRPEWTKAFVVP